MEASEMMLRKFVLYIRSDRPLTVAMIRDLFKPFGDCEQIIVTEQSCKMTDKALLSGYEVAAHEVN